MKSILTSSVYSLLLCVPLICLTLSSCSSQFHREKLSVNDNWKVSCSVNRIEYARLCFASTSGYIVDRKYGSIPNDSKGGLSIKTELLQIYFVNNSGPYVYVGANIYPGFNPTVRIDDKSEIKVNQDGGATSIKPDPEIVEQMLNGKNLKIYITDSIYGVTYFNCRR